MLTEPTSPPMPAPTPASTAAPVPAADVVGRAASRRDWRPGPRAQAVALAAGGGIYALSHALNLLGSTPGLDAPHEIASKYLFGAGALLIMAGLGSVMRGFARSPLGVLGAQLTWSGMLFILLSAYSMLYVFPVFGWEGLHRIDELAVIPALLTIPTVLLGPVLLAIAAWRHRVMAWWTASLLLLSVAGMVVMIGIPELEPPFAIGSTIVAGVSYLFAGIRLARTPAA